MSEITHESAILAAALEYAAQGKYVFPARLGIRGDGRKDVRPIDAWRSASTTDPDVIRGWFTNGWAGAALCIDTGKSGLVAVDQDVHDGAHGPENWAALAPAPTARVRTPTGGLHDYYQADPERSVSVANRGEVADGVDIRGDGGFVFAPPTRDPRGGSWEWEAGTPDWTTLPTVPAVVPDRLAAAQAKRRKRPEPQLTGGFSSVSNGDENPGNSTESSLLFDEGERDRDFGPDGGWKTVEDAVALLSRRTADFTALTEPNSGRSHILAQDLGVLAGHGVPGYWTYEQALKILLDACEANGFTDIHGERYADQQARRGLDYGMLEPWHVPPAPVASEALQMAVATGESAVDKLMAKLLDRDALAAIPDARPLVVDLLDLDSESWIIGASGGFKSFVALDIACHVANGLPWRGRDVTKGTVLYVVAEGAKSIRKRVQAWEKTYGHQADGVLILPEPVQAASRGAKAGVGPEWMTLVEVAKRVQPVLIVLDTQARLTVGLNENDNGEMGVFVDAVGRLKRAAGSCVLVVHHTGRSGGDARGASAIDAAQDTELKVKRASGARRDELIAEIFLDKQKDDDDRIKIEFQMEVVTVGQNQWTGKPLTSLALIPENPFASSLFKPEVIPEWKLNLADMAAEVMVVMVDHAGENGATNGEIKRWIKERRIERGDDREVRDNTLSSAIKKLCGEVKSAEGTWTGQELERAGYARVRLPES